MNETKSKKPRKQHKKLYKMPLHKRRKQLSANLSKNLRGRYGKRNFPVRKEDKIKILRGKNRGKSGKVIGINLKKGTIAVEKIVVKKPDGTEKPVPIKASNVQITEFGLGDKKREDALGRGKKIKKGKPMDEIETKEEKKE